MTHGCKLTPIKDSKIRNASMTYLDPMLTVMKMKPLVPSGGEGTIERREEMIQLT
jgi:hypothetical protein